jgi:hypothetical protein
MKGGFDFLSAAPGIEVREQPLNCAEAGFLAGMFEAWANRTMTEADFRSAWRGQARRRVCAG